MANTTYFGWETPDDTDLVKDGAAAIRTLGQAIDTSLQDLEGGTTGQILSKNSNTDMDFVWVTNDVGDITEVVAGTGLSGGGSSGSVTLTNTVATEFDAKGDLVVGTGADTFDKLTAGTNETRLVAASGETTGLKYVADTTNYAIAAKGDLLVGTAADTLAALTVGTNGHILVADSAEATGLKWAAPAGGGKVLQVVSTIKTDTFSLSSTTTLTDITGLSVSITPSSTNSKIFITAHVGVYDTSVGSGFGFALLRGATKIAAGDTAGNRNLVTVGGLHDANNGAPVAFSFLDSPATTSSTTYKIQLYNNNATGYVNRTSEDSDTASYPRGSSTITVWEIGA